MIGNQKLFWINPLAHHVYDGWLRFFNNFFQLEVYDCNLWVKYPFVEQKKLKHIKSISIGKSGFFNIYKNKFGIKKDDIVVVGDIFTNSLCLTLRGGNVIYYTEYFLHGKEGFFKRLMFFIIRLLWKNKKIIVPTLKALETWKPVSSKILYLPEIYFGELHENKSLKDKKLKILFVGALDDWKKNVKFMLDALINIKDENIEIGLCGPNNAYGGFNSINIEKYKKIFGKKFIYYGKLPHNELESIYCNYNLFILPSIVDPIGAVILEAMAHSMPIMVSKNVGAGDYIVEGKNGFLFDSASKKDFLAKLKKFDDQKIRMKFGKSSKDIVCENYLYKNNNLLKLYYENFLLFILK